MKYRPRKCVPKSDLEVRLLNYIGSWAIGLMRSAQKSNLRADGVRIQALASQPFFS